MKPVWLIEADVFREASEPLKNEIRRQGMTCHVVVHRPTAAPPNDLVGAAEIPADAPVIFRGSHPLMRHIQLTRRWSPGVGVTSSASPVPGITRTFYDIS